MSAAHRCGQPARAAEIGQRALDAAARNKTADFGLRRLVEQVTTEESRFGIAVRATSRQRPAVPESTREAKAAMSEPGNTFNNFNINFNNEGAQIENEVAQVNAKSIHYYAKPITDQPAERADDTETGDDEQQGA
jgi:hypothetical protein